MARAQGLLVDDGDQYQLAAHGAIPATLQALLAARLDALEPEQKLALQHAAVMGGADGRAPRRPGVARRVGRTAVPSSRTASCATPPTAASTPWTPCLREVAYETLPRNIRGELHRRAATIVEEPEERARHLDRAAAVPRRRRAPWWTRQPRRWPGPARTSSLAARHIDALRLLERAVALGCRRSTALLDLAKVQALCGQDDEALSRRWRMVEDDPDDPTVAIERDHTAANAKVFTDPAWALPRLEAVTARWHALGSDRQRGVGARQHGRLVLQPEPDGGSGPRARTRAPALRATSTTGRARSPPRRSCAWPDRPTAACPSGSPRRSSSPTRPGTARGSSARSPPWRGTTSSGRCGAPPHDTAEAEGFARRLAELAEELGALDMAVHGRSLLAITARFTGRLDEAAHHAEVLQRLSGLVDDDRFPWLGRAATFAVDVARGATGVAPPLPPAPTPDPVVGMAPARRRSRAHRGRARATRRWRASTPPSAPDWAPSAIWPALLNGPGARPGRSGATEALPWVERAAVRGPGSRCATRRRWPPPRCGPRSPGQTTGPAPAPASAASISEALVLRSTGRRGDTWRARRPARCAPETRHAGPARRAVVEALRALARKDAAQPAADASCPTKASRSLWRIGNDPPHFGHRT